MEYSDLIRCRYSCRSFSGKPVEPEKLEKILEAGMVAPTAQNKQPFQIFNMQSQQATDAVRSVTSCHFGADCFLILAAKPQAGFIRAFDGRDYAATDAAIAGVHMMLEIQNQGLGTTWVGWFDAPRLKQLYPQLRDLDLIAIFPIGYPAADAVPAPKHSQRNPLSQLVTQL